MVKKKTDKETVKKSSGKVNKDCTCKYFFIKLSAMAFILFLVTVWPAVGNWLVGVPWWVYLIILVISCGLAAGVKDKCWCYKK